MKFSCNLLFIYILIGRQKQVSKIRSLTLDKWSSVRLELIRSVGNTAFNTIWEANTKKASNISRPGSECTRSEAELWIKAKYIDKEFIRWDRYSFKNQEERDQALIDSAGNTDVCEVLALIAHGARVHQTPAALNRATAAASVAQDDNDLTFAVIAEVLVQNGCPGGHETSNMANSNNSTDRS